MTPDDIDRLKQDWTGRRVTVASPSPALLRFAGRPGTVVTINMNGRALVRFDSPFAGLPDIGWYDLPLQALAPAATPAPPEETAPPPPGQPPLTSATKRPEPTPPPAPPAPTHQPAKASILELARRQGAAKRP